MKKKPKKKNIMLLLTVCIIYVGYVLISQQMQMYKVNKEMKANDAKIASEQKEIDNLNQTKQIYRSDEFIERMARERLGYVKAGEKVYIDRSTP